MDGEAHKRSKQISPYSSKINKILQVMSPKVIFRKNFK